MPPCPICRASNPISHRTKKGQFSIHFWSILCIKYFLICKIKRYVIMFFVYENRFLAWQLGKGRSGTVMAFIPDNIFAHVHLLEDNDPIKKQRWLLSAGVFRLPQKQQECFSEDHDRFISVDSVGREKSIYTTSNFFKLWCSY